VRRAVPCVCTDRSNVSHAQYDCYIHEKRSQIGSRRRRGPVLAGEGEIKGQARSAPLPQQYRSRVASSSYAADSGTRAALARSPRPPDIPSAQPRHRDTAPGRIRKTVLSEHNARPPRGGGMLQCGRSGGGPGRIGRLQTASPRRRGAPQGAPTRTRKPLRPQPDGVH
jgi:hypothetical protein